jgi:CheY-like chemotaxis protein
MAMKPSAMNILLVEDNEGDVELTRIAFRKGDFPSALSVAHDGVEAVEYLNREGKFQEATRPDLILLDLNMPRMDGKEFLALVKGQDKWKAIPIIVLTSSSAPRDIQECYERHVNCYILKPPDLSAFITVAQQVWKFWLNLVRLPQPR